MTLSRIEPKKSGKAFELASNLQTSTECVDKLSNHLLRERDALTTGDIEALDQCGKLKSECVVQLETLDSRRKQLCRELAVENEEIDNFLNNQHTVNASDMWKTFLTKLERCSEANTLNGSFVRIRRSHVEKALNILRGSSASPSLYGPNGMDCANEATQLGSA